MYNNCIEERDYTSKNNWMGLEGSIVQKRVFIPFYIEHFQFTLFVLNHIYTTDCRHHSNMFNISLINIQSAHIVKSIATLHIEELSVLASRYSLLCCVFASPMSKMI